MQALLLRLLVLLLTLLSCSLSWADEIKVRALGTSYGTKVFLDGLRADYTLSNSNGVITLLFEEEMEYVGLQKFSKSIDIIRNIVPQPKSLNIFLKNPEVRVEKFKEKNVQGFNIFDPQKPQTQQNSHKGGTSQRDIPLRVEMAPDALKLIFKWSEDVGSAVFQRDDRLWIAFGEGANFKISQDALEYLPSIAQIETGGEGSFIALRPSDVAAPYSRVLAYRSGMDWVVEFNNKKAKPYEIKVIPRPFAAPSPRVELEFDSKALDPIRFIDPDIGDTLLIIPTSSVGYGVSMEYKFVDFEVLPSYQGAVLHVISDFIETFPKGNFVYVRPSNPLNISPKIFTRGSKGEVDAADFTIRDLTTSKSILDLTPLVMDGKPFGDKLLEMHGALRNAVNQDRRMQLYTTLALFYMANGFYQEATIVIKLLKQEDIDYANHYDIKLIEGGLAFRMQEYVEAYKLFSSIDITDVPILQRKEVRFWQAVSGYMVSNAEDFLGRLDPMALYLDDAGSFLEAYTIPFKLDFGIAIAKYKIKSRQYDHAQNIINQLDKLQLTPHQLNSLHLVKAENLVALGQLEEAVVEWDACIGDVEDLQHRVQCIYQKARTQYENGMISADAYTKELELLELIWRGDDVEVEVLRKLGSAYLKRKDYINTLRAWKKIIDYYPYSPDALQLSRQIGETFVKFFTAGMDKEVSHMQAVAIFYEFEDLVPIGAVGDDLVLRFTDHLIALDLLDRAAMLLHHQIVYRLKGYRKETAINKLVQVYLAQQRPELAIESIILLGDEYEELPDDIAKERRHLHALAYLKNEEDGKALQLLQDDLSEPADDIVAEIYWRRKDWVHFNQRAEPKIYSIRKDTDTLSAQDAVRVLKLAISYLMLNERKLAKDLLTDFQKRMPNNNVNSELLVALNETWSVINNTSLNALKDLTAVQKKVSQLLSILVPSTH